ncbi:type II CRISPR RNA-guided endonuclease Cas9 [Lactobacillus acetotolerans]|uniref:type II CRISPR RNA-guided endonuclease Cas9 n=1 Tax=Lactobacillus acetotolerans TaxID=1600 RepID=UPI0007BAC929|nr:type II CRISPR RNA-guided endonuclease Cas9 [Lactobacillus acetotolerans]QGV04081.1 type II CRISPR RNA-guided endonuclease Cas9 [Lactobacillus acetotolerans]
MTKVKEDYIIGLDIGTNSCGWVATDKKNNILHLQNKTAIGSHLFEEGHSAADRRLFRGTRRRLNRRKWRLKFLEEIFDPYISKIDPYFFARMKESGLSPKDSRKKARAIIFPTPKEDSDFYYNYPTIYHLRNALMTKNKKFDLREIYLAIHHIVKYRGNFLQNAPVKSFDVSANDSKSTKIDVKEVLQNLNDYFSESSTEDQVEFNIKNSPKIESIIKNKTIRKLDKDKQIGKLLFISSKNKDVDKQNKNIAKQVANAILGYKTQFETIFSKEIDKNDKTTWEFKLSDADADDKLEILLPELDENQQTIIDQIRQLFNSITLSGIVDEGKTLSASMIRKYNDHKKDLVLLKDVIISQDDEKKAKKLALAYDLYVNNRHGKLLEAKKEFKVKGVLSKDDFYKIIKNNLDDSNTAKEILHEIELDSFMSKQRTNQNGVIPYQLHQVELDRIIKKQSKYYSFLAEENPIKEHQKQAPYKLDELVRFRVPYYVGPLITATDQKKSSGKNFAWMIRKAQGQITPWNFDRKVNRMDTANKFIKRMTTKDTYLLGEDVLPANSLLYQKFTVLNELNNIRINDHRISVNVKQDVYENLFKKYKTISLDKLSNYLKENYNLPSVEINGLSDKSNNPKFNSSLTTYYQLKHLDVLSDKIDDSKYRSDLEHIIEWSTIFEDKSIYIEKLKTVNWLTSEQIKALSNLQRYQGWGRLSRKLLTGIHDKHGRTIMKKLWYSQKNFMQIVNEPDFKAAIEKENGSVVQTTSMEDILADAYTSPANKKAVRQVIKVTDDIVKAASGKVPVQFAIEFARETEKNPKLSQVRGSKLRQVYENIFKKTATKLVDVGLKDQLNGAIESRKLVRDKYFLYFMQGGRDAYTGEKIKIDKIDSKYQIDHILPQAFIKDDSFNNRVLTLATKNNEKSDKVPFEYGYNQADKGRLGITIRQMWDKWSEWGLISKRKYNNLILDPNKINKYQKAGFINRQLVETSQIIRLVATILQAKYPKTEIIVVKAGYNHALRDRLQLYKSREVNDYHHAIDAYLTTICGNFLYQVYPDLRPFFVYGEFKKFSSNPDLEKQAFKKYKTFNFIWPLLKKKDAPEKIYQFKNGPLVFNKHKDIFDKLRHAYSFKYMPVSRETTTKNQEMFKMTLYPRADRDTKKSRKLIPKAKGMPTVIYGGYSSNSDAYMALVKIKTSKSFIYKIFGVPMRAISKLKLAKRQGKYNQVLKKILTPAIMLDKNGKPKRGVKKFRILKGKVPYRQVVLDGKKKFMIGSTTYIYNAKELTLSSEAMRIITNNLNTNEDRDKSLIKVYDEILEKVDKYLPLYDIYKSREKLHKGREKFINLSVEEKKNIINQILNGLHDNLVMGNLKNIGFNTPFGQMQMQSGITLTPNAKLIYQSPTGLFEKRVKISDL